MISYEECMENNFSKEHKLMESEVSDADAA